MGTRKRFEEDVEWCGYILASWHLFFILVVVETKCWLPLITSCGSCGGLVLV